MDKYQLTEKIRHKAYELGFAKVGFAPADDFDEYAEEFRSRINDYKFLVGGHIDPLKGSYPKDFMPEAKSVVALVWDFSRTIYPEKLTESFGRAYLSRSYLPKSKSVNGARLKLFEEYMESLGIKVAKQLHMPERNACARAGVITYGKNNFAYAEGCGSFVILKAFLIDQELEYDEATVRCDCPPNCHACIDSCPTGALYAQGKLKPQKCMLYNHFGGRYDKQVREKSGQLIHGCDICQMACPRNKVVLKKTPVEKNQFLEMLADRFDMEKVLFMDQDYFEEVIYPIAYNYINDFAFFQRNAAVALGNTKDDRYIPVLTKALNTLTPLVKGCAAWALGEIGGEDARQALLAARDMPELDKKTAKEIEEALDKING